MNGNMKVLGPQNEIEIEHFEKEQLKKLPGDEFEKEMSTWNARWRKESLEHYLKLGWSFGIWDNEGMLLGYSLGQPLLFFQGFTQALWIEHTGAARPEVYEELVQISYRWARDKHLQRVLFSAASLPQEMVAACGLKPLSEDVFELKTSKYE